MEDDTQPDTDSEPNRDVNLVLILKELREFRKESSWPLNGIREDSNRIYTSGRSGGANCYDRDPDSINRGCFVGAGETSGTDGD